MSSCSSDDEMPALQPERGASVGSLNRGGSSEAIPLSSPVTGGPPAFSATNSGGFMSHQVSTYSSDFTTEETVVAVAAAAPAVAAAAPKVAAETRTIQTQTGDQWCVTSTKKGSGGAGGGGSNSRNKTTNTAAHIYLGGLPLEVENKNFGWLTTQKLSLGKIDKVVFSRQTAEAPIPAEGSSQLQRALIGLGTPLPPGELTHCFLSAGVNAKHMLVSARTYEPMLACRNEQYISLAQSVARSLVKGDLSAEVQSRSNVSGTASFMNSLVPHIRPAGAKDTSASSSLFPREEVFSSFNSVQTHLAPFRAAKKNASSSSRSSAAANPKPHKQQSHAGTSIDTTNKITPTAKHQPQQQQRKPAVVTEVTSASLGTEGDCSISTLVGGGKSMTLNCGIEQMDRIIYATKCSFANGGECLMPGGKVVTAADLVAMGKDPTNLSDDFLRKFIMSNIDAGRRNQDVLAKIMADSNPVVSKPQRRRR